jgi:hypothetical protein
MPGRERRRPLTRVRVAVAATVVAALTVAAIAAVEERAEPAVAPAPTSPPPPPPTERPSGEWRQAPAGERPARPRPEPERVEWRSSESIGSHAAGRLHRGVLLPERGKSWTTWDPILKRRPNREWRRWGSDRLVRATLAVLREFGRAHPNAPRVAVGDLSRPHGGDFGPRFGSIGHGSHQNGLDVDVYYPRTDRRVRPPKRPGQVDVRFAQDLVDRFVAAGAEKVFVGPSLPLTGPQGIVVPLVNHDNHLHARLPL